MDSNRIEFTFEGEGGFALFARGWLSHSPGDIVILLIHGIGEHSGRYTPLAQAFNEQGISVIAMDLRGHGKSGGKRGHTPSMNTWLHDIRRFVASVQTRVVGKMWLLYGHSLGGNLALNYLLRLGMNLHGGIITSPELRLAFAPPRWKVGLAGLMNRILPEFTMSTGLDITAISHQESVWEAYRQDPLVHDRISPRTFISFMEGGEWAIAHATALMQPVLLMHGDADRITSYAASEEFARHAGPLCTFVGWPGAFHELHNDLELKQFLAKVVEWIHLQHTALEKGVAS